MSAAAFDLAGPLPTGRTVIEASAGTGKTYSIAALVARYVAGEITGPGHDLAEGIDVAEVLVVTFTRAAASELRDRIRRTLRVAADFLDGEGVAEPWMSVFDAGSHRVRHRRSARLRDALARFDEATITTIHGFCQQALGQSGIRSTSDPGVELVDDSGDIVAEVCRDALLARLLDDPLALSTDESDKVPGPDGRGARPPAKVENYLVQTVKAVLSNPGARFEPPPGSDSLEGEWAALVADVVAGVAARQRARRQIGYDRLISDLRDMLADPVGGRQLAEQLAQRYRLVLVDEFQDTDRLQWEVFDLAFAGNRLVTVGDPKQAIYRFRGADVHAYLDAVRHADVSTLGTNHRSDRRLLDAVGLLFHGATLGHDDIAFRRVEAAPTATPSAMGNDAALHIRVVPDDPSIPRTSTGLSAVAVQRVVVADVASRIRTLLDTATITLPGDEPRRVRPTDIAVLVPSQRRAAEVAAVLRDWSIPSVRARTGSVLGSEAAVQWRLLLGGLVAPTNARVARAAGLGWFFDLEPFELADDFVGDGFESPLAALQRRLAVLAERLRSSGVGAFYEWWRTESGVLATVLSRANGDRNIADLDHVADLLTAATSHGSSEPVRVQHALEALIAAADDQAEATMRRIETDDEAVQITTIHSAKGLEYPIVLLPFVYADRSNVSRPYVYNVGSSRVIDVASWVAWTDDPDRTGKQAKDARRGAAAREVDGDSLRLLYVAMTRAKHRVEVWWAPTKRSGTSAFGRLLYDRIGPGKVENTATPAPFEKMGENVEMTRRQLAALVGASNGTIAVADVPVAQPVRRPLPIGAATRPDLRLAESGRGPLDDPGWKSWSFTAITRSLDEPGPAEQPAVEPLAAGGLDEPAAAVDASIPQVAGAARSQGPVVVPLSDVVGGTTFGTMVHEVLEHVDFTSPTVVDDVRQRAEAGVRRAGLSLDIDTLTAGLVAAIDTPLGPLFGGAALRDIPPADRLAELTFDVAIADGAPITEAAARVGAVLTGTLDAGDPLRPYAGQLTAELGALSLRGWLNGSVDAVFRVGTGVDQRFVVVDYKSNRLHEPGAADPLDAYRPDRLVAAMTHSHYPLQALLYSVALHRYLTWRLGTSYDPDRHLGGTAYLFVRGMVGPDTPTVDGVPHGVFSWRPPTTTIVALDALFRPGGPA